MTDYDNTNRGAVWGNEKKESDRHPDFTGSLNVDGKEYYVSAWRRKEGASDRAPALSFSVKPKEQSQHQQSKANGYQEQPDSFDNSDIPFN